MPTPAIFLDRDGVIIENRPDYVRDWSQVAFFHSGLQALAAVAKTPYLLVIITNQSAVGRGIITLSTAQQINQRLVTEIEKRGGRIDAVYMCPHAPHEKCACRKPAPGLIQQATADLNIDLPRSILIGDALTDIQAGRLAGIGQNVLVLTGRGPAQCILPEADALQPFPVAADLYAALNTHVPGL